MAAAARGVRVVLCLALLASQPACVLSRLTIDAARGIDNGLLVRAVASLDDAWLVPEKGLVLCGIAAPGLRGSLFDDPPGQPLAARFAAGIPLGELTGGRAPQLSYDRFHEPPAAACDCAAKLPGARHVSVSESPGVALVNPAGVGPSELTLERQALRIDPLPELANPPLEFALGPRGRQPAYWALLPPALVADAGVNALLLAAGLATQALVLGTTALVGIGYYGFYYPATYLVTGAPPVSGKPEPPPPQPDPCRDFVPMLFPAGE